MPDTNTPPSGFKPAFPSNTPPPGGPVSVNQTQPQPTQPAVPRPQTPPFSPPPGPKPQQTQQPIPQPFQSPVRTMESDLANLRKSQPTSGSTFQPPMPPKPAFPLPPPLGGLPTAPKPAVPPASASIIPKTGQAEVPKPGFSVPQKSSPFANKRFLMIGIIVLALAAGGVYWYFMMSSDDQDLYVSPTPAPVASETPAPNLFESEFGTPSMIVVQKGYPNFADLVMSGILNISEPELTLGEFRSFNIVDENNSKYTFGEFLENLGVSYDVSSPIVFDTTDWVFGMYNHTDDKGMVVSKPFIVLKASDIGQANDAMLKWGVGNSLVNNLAGLFGYQAAEASLESDIYNGLNFKFAKVPSRDSGVAYVVFDNYLVIASSRDSFRAAVDALNISSLDK